MKIRVIKRPPATWMKWLFYVNIAGVAASLAAWLPVKELPFWLNLIQTLGVAACLGNLGVLNGRYKKASVMMAVNLLLLVLNRNMPSALFTLPASVLSIIAAYQEYNGHSELVAEKDPGLSRNWHSLFNWEIIVGVLTAVLSVAAAVILVLGELGTGVIVTVITVLMQLVSLVLGVLYLVYLYRTVKLME